MRLRLELILIYLTHLKHSSALDSSRKSVSASVSTCPSRTVNYITHKLPQQCLATSRGENTTTTINLSLADTVTEDKSASTDAGSDAKIVYSHVPVVTLSDLITLSSTTSVSLPTASPPTAEIVPVTDSLDEESALESGSFLSFEEWKRQNLKKAGQPEHLGQKAAPGSSPEPRRRPERSLESLGDDGEIDIDFSGLVPGGPGHSPREASTPLSEISPQAGDESPQSEGPTTKARSKDAGTTCKERFNYASFDCAAGVLKTNKEAKNPNTVLVENKDSYMLNKCSANEKFIILELCNDILVDTVVLANFEFFSSTFRTFRVSVSDRYPVKVDKWKPLGTYEARNTREIQAFLVENPIIWARYLRIDFMSHYGNEFYCPVSLVRVHGTTMMEDYRHEQELLLGEEDEDVEEVEFDERKTGESSKVDSLTPEAIAEPLKTSANIMAETSTSSEVVTVPTIEASQKIEAVTKLEPALPASVAAIEAIASVIESGSTCLPAESPKSAQQQSSSVDGNTDLTAESLLPLPSLSIPETIHVANTSQSVVIAANTTESPSRTFESEKNVSGLSSTTESSNSTSHNATSVSLQHTSTSTLADKSAAGTNRMSIQTVPQNSTSTEKIKASATSHSAPAVPTTQDSFFKSVQKRLQMLEANSSMSLQYIEEQSRALRDAFKKVEQRQLARTNTFLEQLNHTVLRELREFRQQYDQLWQSTVIELELHRERYERDNIAINTRIGILADEVIFQRRMAILQMVLILVCLALVLFSRGAINNYLELPIVQNVLAKSHSSRWLSLSTDSRSRPAKPVRALSAQQLRTERTGILKGHQRMQSEDSITDAHSGNEIYAPPTPNSDFAHSEVELVDHDSAETPMRGSDMDDAQTGDDFDPSMIERPATSPPVLHLNGDVAFIDEAVSADPPEHYSTPMLPSNETFDDAHHMLTPVSSTSTVKRLSWSVPADS